MSVVDVYRLQQTIHESKIILNDESLVGGENFKLVDEKGKETSFTIPTPTGEESAYFEKIIEGGHIYTLYQIVEDETEGEVANEIDKQVITWGDTWNPQLTPKIDWDGSVYTDGVKTLGRFDSFDAISSVSTNTLKEETTLLRWTGNTYAERKVLPIIKGSELCNFNNFFARGSINSSSTSYTGSIAFKLLDESTLKPIATLTYTSDNRPVYLPFSLTQRFEADPNRNYSIDVVITTQNSGVTSIACLNAFGFTKI